ncbi:MAG TPA: helix-turn-helix transcriptional regulator [Saprospiraceae bacterium]|nr:helix-turn-helix transcriptional regulator [Saprospiraceae bacterium]HPG08420.1 helix-turn-helix transcriptional regulator [Saprospiraceae bacterium]HRV84730.1 helix-turn-helix transcriptional regulator [Saprospiraceae bacterium]
MNPLVYHRERLNITQKELADQSGVSVRTIQRIEAGEMPKGYSRKALAKSLGIDEIDLLEKKETGQPILRYINFIPIPFLILPPLQVIAPLIIMYYYKNWSPTAKKMVDIQMVWLIATAILVVLSSFVKRLLNDNNMVTLTVVVVALLANLFVLVKNGIQLQKNGKLQIALKFSIL